MGKRRARIVKPPHPTYRSGKPVKFKIPWGVRKIIIKRDGFICKYCGTELTFETHTIDHIQPASKGGTEHPNNLVMCCERCNRKVKDLEFPDFNAKRKYLLELKDKSNRL